LVEKYVDGYWRGLNSEYHCRAALRVEIVAVVVALGEAKLEIWITTVEVWIIPVVLIVKVVLRILIEGEPYLLSIAMTIWFDDLHAPGIEAVARIETEYQVGVILYAYCSRIRTWA
jgi:hypothetical protein